VVSWVGKKRRRLEFLWDQGAGLRRRTLLVAGSSPLAPRPALSYGPSCIEVEFLAEKFSALQSL